MKFIIYTTIFFAFLFLLPAVFAESSIEVTGISKDVSTYLGLSTLEFWLIEITGTGFEERITIKGTICQINDLNCDTALYSMKTDRSGNFVTTARLSLNAENGFYQIRVTDGINEIILEEFLELQEFSKKEATLPSIKLYPDANFTAATFADEYKDILFQDDGTRIPVFIKVIGDPISEDPNTRPREIRHLQSSVLKFLNLAQAINTRSDLWENQLTTQIHPLWIEPLRKRSDVISVETNLEKIGSPRKQIEQGILPQDIVCKQDLKLMLRPNDSAACIRTEHVEKLESYGWELVLKN